MVELKLFRNVRDFAVQNVGTVVYTSLGNNRDFTYKIRFKLFLRIIAGFACTQQLLVFQIYVSPKMQATSMTIVSGVMS